MRILQIFFLSLFIVACKYETINNNVSEKTYDCDYLIIGYEDGDGNLVYSVENDLLNLSLGLRSCDASTTRVLIMYDGIDNPSPPTVFNTDGGTYLFEIKSLSKSLEEELTIQDIIKTDYTSSCGFIPL